MSVLQVYINWVNSVLADLGGCPCPGAATVQEGKILCQLIDTLYPDANLMRKAEAAPNPSAHAYLRTALDHMQSHGIKFHFTPQDILDGDIKSILDILWNIILNYAVHTIGSSPYQRSVGIGKKLLLDWCQRELLIEFDTQKSLTYNLCTGDWFLKLLSMNSDIPLNELIDKEQNVKIQLIAIENKYGIKHGLINPSQIVEGTINEHTLMIYISLLRLKIGDSVDGPLASLNELLYPSIERPSSKPDIQLSSVPVQLSSVPVIVLSEMDNSLNLGVHLTDNTEPVQNEFVISTHSSYTELASTNTSPRKRSQKEINFETFDWIPQSAGSHMFSIYNDQRLPIPDAESLLTATISQHKEDQITAQENSTQQEDSQKHSEEPTRTSSSSQRLQDFSMEKGNRKVSVKIQRPRSPNSIMAEAQQEQEKERTRRENDEHDRPKKEENDRDEHVMTDSAYEGDFLDGRIMERDSIETDPIKFDDGDMLKHQSGVCFPMRQQMNGNFNDGVPVFVMSGQKHNVEVVLEALQNARTDANMPNQSKQSIPTDQPNARRIVNKNIEQLKAQLATVKTQSKELFEDSVRKQDIDGCRGGVTYREQHRSQSGEERSPLDGMFNQTINDDNTVPKKKFSDNENGSHSSMQKHRHHSPNDFARTYQAENSGRDIVNIPNQNRSVSPHKNGIDEEHDPDKCLIKYLTNEIEKMKLKMAVMEQKHKQRSQSPNGVGNMITSCLPEREQNPSQVNTKARAHFTESITVGNPSSHFPTYSPIRRAKSTEFMNDIWSRSPRIDSPTRSSSKSQACSPVCMLTSRISERISMNRIHSGLPSARVLSLQDLSSSINDDLDGNLTFSPASGARPLNLGYSSPICKVSETIWGYEQTEDDHIANTVKYEDWKKLVSQDVVTDDDNLELKQALASALVELNILQAKLKNANSDRKFKMSKTSEVLNDCRAHMSKSQAENAVLRSQIEQERSKAVAQELKIKELEQTMHSAKSNEDKTLELEESVMTLKGIMNVNRNQMAHLEEGNDKLREKMSEFHRENIKMKEDFNELQIYNNKAQKTIKDLKSCLEDAKVERSQLIREIKMLKEQQEINSNVSFVVNHCMEKNSYEDAEKDHLLVRESSRSVSPNSDRTFPMSRTLIPVQSSSPLQGTESNFAVSRSNTPTHSSFNNEDISPAFLSSGHEIYPHRRTKSYIQKFGTQYNTASPVNLNDSEIEELLRPKTIINYDLDFNNTCVNDGSPIAKRQLVYSTSMDKVPRAKQLVEDNMTQESPLTSYKSKSTIDRKSSIDEDLNNKHFMTALDSAVKQTPAHLGQQCLLRDHNIFAAEEDARDRWRFQSMRILRNAKSLQNMSIKDSSIPTYRSFQFRSYSPSVRSSVLRPYSHEKITSTACRQPFLNLLYSSNTFKDNAYFPSARNRAHSLKSGGHTFASVNKSFSQDQFHIQHAKDGGYNTPTHPAGRFQSSVTNSSRDNNQPRFPTRLQSEQKMTAGLLSDEERQYADLLIDKYTRQQFTGIHLALS